MKTYGALKRLQRLAGLQADAARLSAQWLAVTRWAMKHRPATEAYAASEMLAQCRRKVSGRPDRFCRQAIYREAAAVRYEWLLAKAPGFKPAVEFTYKFLQRHGYRIVNHRAAAH